MANKEKEVNHLTKTTIPVEKEVNEEALKAQLQERVEYHNGIAKKREEVVGEANRLNEAITHVRGEINNIQNLINEYFAKDAPSVNGEA